MRVSQSGYPITIGPYYGIYRQVTTCTTISFPSPCSHGLLLPDSHESRMQLFIWCRSRWQTASSLHGPHLPNPPAIIIRVQSLVAKLACTLILVDWEIGRDAIAAAHWTYAFYALCLLYPLLPVFRFSISQSGKGRTTAVIFDIARLLTCEWDALSGISRIFASSLWRVMFNTVNSPRCYSHSHRSHQSCWAWFTTGVFLSFFFLLLSTPIDSQAMALSMTLSDESEYSSVKNGRFSVFRLFCLLRLSSMLVFVYAPLGLSPADGHFKSP